MLILPRLTVYWFSGMNFKLIILNTFGDLQQISIKYLLHFQCVNPVAVTDRAVLGGHAYSALWVRLFCKI